MPRKRKYTEKKYQVPPREALRALGNVLRQVANSDRPAFEQPIDPDIAKWAANGIEHYLSGEIDDLERALDLKPGPGRQRKPTSSDEIELGREIFGQLALGKSWVKVAEAINWQTDESGLRELWNRIEPDVYVDISNQINLR